MRTKTTSINLSDQALKSLALLKIAYGGTVSNIVSALLANLVVEYPVVLSEICSNVAQELFEKAYRTAANTKSDSLDKKKLANGGYAQHFRDLQVTDEMIKSALEVAQKRSRSNSDSNPLTKKYSSEKVALRKSPPPNQFFLTIQSAEFPPDAETMRKVLLNPASYEERLNAAEELKVFAPEMVKVAIEKTREFYLHFPEVIKSMNLSGESMDIREAFYKCSALTPEVFAGIVYFVLNKKQIEEAVCASNQRMPPDVLATLGIFARAFKETGLLKGRKADRDQPTTAAPGKKKKQSRN